MRASVNVSTLVTALVALTSASPAAGQAVPDMELAGGSVPATGPHFSGSEVGLKVNDQGDLVTIRASAAISCRRTEREGNGVGTGQIGADGAFVVRLKDGVQLSDRGLSSVIVASGRVAGDRATGTLRVRIKRRKRTICTREVSYAARVVPDLAAAAPAEPPAGATLIGRAGGLAPSGAPFSFNFRVSRDGRMITRGTSGYFMRWNRRNRGLEETNYLPRVRIRSDATFSSTERYTFPLADGLDHTTVRVVGRFVEGGATGTFRVTSRFRSRGTGRLLARGDSGLMVWNAAP